MSKYIDTEKLKATLETRIAAGMDGYGGNLKWLLENIDSLQQEQQEVDLEKEIDNYIGSHFSEAHDGVLLSDASGMELTITDIAPIARHFYELGLNARKEE